MQFPVPPPDRRQRQLSQGKQMKEIRQEEEEESNNAIKQVRILQNQKMRAATKGFTLLPLANNEQKEFIPNSLNIILFGPSGSGKSSLIKTLYQALNEKNNLPDEIKEDLIIQKLHHNEGTKRLTKVSIKKGSKQLIETGKSTYTIENTSINCLDTRGQVYLSDNEMEQLNLLIDGRVKNMSLVEQRTFRYAVQLWEFWKKSSELFPTEILQNGASLESSPHCIIIVFDGSLDEIPNGEEETKFYRQILASLQKRNYFQPQIVMSRLDLVEKRMKNVFEKYQHMTEMEMEMKFSEIIDHKIQQVVHKLQVPRSSVHFIENYNQLNQKYDENINYYALKLLQECLVQGEQYISSCIETKLSSQNILQKIFGTNQSCNTF